MKSQGYASLPPSVESFNIRVCRLAIHGRMKFTHLSSGNEGRVRHAASQAIKQHVPASMFFFNVLHPSITYPSSNNHLQHSQLSPFSSWDVHQQCGSLIQDLLPNTTWSWIAWWHQGEKGPVERHNLRSIQSWTDGHHQPEHVSEVWKICNHINWLFG